MRIVLFFTILLFATCAPTRLNEAAYPDNKAPDNMAYKIGQLALDATAHDTEWFKPRPTVTSRILGLVFTSVFDAWSRYDANANSLYVEDIERRPEEERTLRNKEIAICYAAYNTLSHYYFSDSTMFRKFMTDMGLDPDDKSTDPSTPQGIGNLAAQKVISARATDGSNEKGVHPDGKKERYADYTGYSPLNHPDTLVELSRWQPKYFADGKGGYYAPACLTPHWYYVEPLLLDSASQFRPGPPPAIGSEQLKEEVADVIEMQANLTNEEKALVEFMRDGPASVQQAGHWLIFAQDVSVRDGHNLDDDVKMYFLVAATAMDGFIACWDSKMFYDFARPYALVHDYYQDQVIRAWGGPSTGNIDMKGQEWRPYSPETFLCPPFPSYVSGHSTISGGCAEILKLYKGSDNFGISVKLVPGIMTEPDNIGDTVTLEFPTFTETAEMAGISRVLGGYHIQADNIEGLELGRRVAHEVWRKYNKLIGEGEAQM